MYTLSNARFMRPSPQIMAKIKMLTGVVEVGLFCHMAQAAYFGNEVSITLFFPLRLYYSFCESGWQRDSKVERWEDRADSCTKVNTEIELRR
jgi:hypothetical protein